MKFEEAQIANKIADVRSTAEHLQFQCLVTVDSSAKMGALGIIPRMEQGHSSRMCSGGHPAPARSTAPRADRGRAPVVPAQAGLYMQSLFHPGQASPHIHVLSEPGTAGSWEGARHRGRAVPLYLQCFFWQEPHLPPALKSGSAAASEIQTEAGWSHQG